MMLEGDDMETTLGKLIAKYKKAPSDELYRTIWNGIMSDELSEALDQIIISLPSDWFAFSPCLRVKRVVDRRYLVAEAFEYEGGFVGFCYSIDLNQYTEKQIAGYKRNCLEFEDIAPDDDFYSAAAVALAYPEGRAKASCSARDMDELENWIKRLDAVVR